MGRMFAVVAGLAAVAAAAAVYALKQETRRVESEVHALERAIERAESDIAGLKAERYWLGRPERIDQLSREQGLGPIHPTQYVRPPPVAKSAPRGAGQ